MKPQHFKHSVHTAPELGTTATAATQNCLELHRSDTNLLRDTLTFQLGLAGNLLLQQTFASAATVSRYFRWLDDLELDDLDEDVDDDTDEPQYELAKAGLGSHGSLELVARPRVDEFLGYLHHPEFSAVVSLAYSVADRDIIGVHLVSFRGKPMLATRWLQGLRRALTRETLGATTPTFVN